MDNDIQPPEKLRPTSLPSTDGQQNSISPPVEPSTQIDEQKIEQEFGPPPEENQSMKSPNKLKLLLLPAFTGHHWPKKRLWLLIALLIVAVAGVTSLAVLNLDKPLKAEAAVSSKKVIPAPTTVASTLTGLLVSPSVNNRPVTAIMIENSTDARPQSGLSQAGVVFEALAEGGITRFMALYQDTQPSYVGPIRSVRPYYIQWALGFDAPIAHVGGSPDALQDLTTWGAKNLDEFYNGNAYTRISSREAPHNVYSSIAQLNQLEASKGYTSSTYSSFPRKKESPEKTPNVTSISLTFSSADYNVQYGYNPTTNSYLRSEGGVAQMDLSQNGTQVQVAPKVVVAMIVPYSLGALDSSGAYYSVYQVIGSGPVYIFQDGTVETGTWAKTSNTAQITFTAANGQALPLNPGQTWIEALASSQDLNYT